MHFYQINYSQQSWKVFLIFLNTYIRNYGSKNFTAQVAQLMSGRLNTLFQGCLTPSWQVPCFLTLRFTWHQYFQFRRKGSSMPFRIDPSPCTFFFKFFEILFLLQTFHKQKPSNTTHNSIIKCFHFIDSFNYLHCLSSTKVQSKTSWEKIFTDENICFSWF